MNIKFTILLILLLLLSKIAYSQFENDSIVTSNFIFNHITKEELSKLPQIILEYDGYYRTRDENGFVEMEGRKIKRWSWRKFRKILMKEGEWKYYHNSKLIYVEMYRKGRLIKMYKI